MLPKLEYIRQARLRLGITQRKLASLAGVSTSMINQIESGRCKPSYDTARRIFEALMEIDAKASPKAGDICSKEVVGVKRNEPLIKAAEIMRERGFSQLPVFDGDRPIGLITDEIIARVLMEKNGFEASHLTVEEVMEALPAIIDASTPAKALIPLLRFSKAILVSENGRIKGIITASDILKMMSE